MDPELKAALDALSKTLTDGLEAANQRADQLETRLNRPRAGGGGLGDLDTPETKAELKAFASFLRHGPDGVSADERKSLALNPDTAGGYLAPEQFIIEMLRNIVLFSGVRQVARVAPMSSHTAQLPRRTGQPTGAWVGETSARPSTESSYGLNSYAAREMACYVDVSNQMLEDSAFDIAAEIAFDLAEEFGRLEGAAFVNGSTPLEPEGFMTNSSVGFTVSGSAATIADATGQANGLIDLFFALAPAYRANATWGMNGTTLGSVQKLKDANNNYIVQSISGSPELRILGRPIVEFPNMPNVAAAAFPIVCGDFRQGYRIFDRVQLSILRDPYSQATNGMTRFHARRRVAGGVGKTEALRKLKVAAS